MIERQVKWPVAGRYVLAVSGGVDSIVLLDLFMRAASESDYELIVAHFDHGIREDSNEDRELVKNAVELCGLKFEEEQGLLGAACNEAFARTARYNFLNKTVDKYNAKLITAHHQDDLLETSILNLARGSGRRGLAPMDSVKPLRPLLNVRKSCILNYALKNGLIWRDDSTNFDLNNPRNFLRRVLLPKAESGWQEEYLTLTKDLSRLNQEIDAALEGGIMLFSEDILAIPKFLARELSLDELSEIILKSARKLAPDVELSSRSLKELALFIKTGRYGKRRPLRDDLWLEIEKEKITLKLA